MSGSALVPEWPAEEEGGLGMTQGPAQLRAKAAALKREASAEPSLFFTHNRN